MYMYMYTYIHIYVHLCVQSPLTLCGRSPLGEKTLDASEEQRFLSLTETEHDLIPRVFSPMKAPANIDIRWCLTFKHLATTEYTILFDGCYLCSFAKAPANIDEHVCEAWACALGRQCRESRAFARLSRVSLSRSSYHRQSQRE